MIQPSKLITQKSQEICQQLEKQARARNSALTHEQIAVINVAGLCEAIIWYLDMCAEQLQSKKSK